MIKGSEDKDKLKFELMTKINSKEERPVKNNSIKIMFLKNPTSHGPILTRIGFSKFFITILNLSN